MSERKRDEGPIWNAVYSHAFVALLTDRNNMMLSRAEAAATAASMADSAVSLMPQYMTIDRGVAGRPAAPHPPVDAADESR